MPLGDPSLERGLLFARNGFQFVDGGEPQHVLSPLESQGIDPDQDRRGEQNKDKCKFWGQFHGIPYR